MSETDPQPAGDGAARDRTSRKRKRGPVMRMLRRLARSSATKRLSIGAYGAWITLCARTTRWRFEGAEAVEARLQAGQPVMIVHWHDRIAMMPYAFDWPRYGLSAIASAHGDADFAVEKGRLHGIDSLRLTRDNPLPVVRAAVRLLRDGRSMLVTPDGPRGPRHVAKPGAIEIAAMGGVPIVPLSYSTTRFLRIRKSWDRFILPMPFARGVFRWGDFIEVPRRLSPDALADAQSRVARAMSDLDALCDRECGRTPE